MNWRSRGVLLVQADVVPQDNETKEISIDQQMYVRRQHSKKLGFVGNLYCVLTSTYMVDRNIDVSKGIANGTLCVLVDIFVKECARVRVLCFEDGSEVHAVFASEVSCLMMKHTHQGWAETSLFHGLPAGTFPVLPLNDECNFQLGTSDSELRTRVTQFPCTISLILTGHKVQGQSLNSIIVGSIASKHQYGAEGWLYVVLSRVRTVGGLHVLQKIPTNVRKYAKRTDVNE